MRSVSSELFMCVSYLSSLWIEYNTIENSNFIGNNAHHNYLVITHKVHNNALTFSLLYAAAQYIISPHSVVDLMLQQPIQWRDFVVYSIGPQPPRINLHQAAEKLLFYTCFCFFWVPTIFYLKKNKRVLSATPSSTWTVLFGQGNTMTTCEQSFIPKLFLGLKMKGGYISVTWVLKVVSQPEKSCVEGFFANG